MEHFRTVVAGVMMAASAAMAGGSDATRAVLVVNAASPASLRIANEYISRRVVPAGNVVVIDKVSNVERLPVEAFRSEILGPVLAEIRRRGLDAYADTILYAADFPSVIDVSGDLGGRSMPAILAPHASINGLTFFAEAVMARETWYLDLACNPYACKFRGTGVDTPWKPEEHQQLAAVLNLLKKPSPGDASADYAQNLAKAAGILDELLKGHPASAILWYNAACCRALKGDGDEAVALIRAAMKQGWRDAQTTATDPDLQGLRERPDFKALVSEIRNLPIEIEPAAPFPGRYGKQRFWLSTMLACTSGRGNSVEEALAYLRRSVAADGSSPNGTVYYEKNSDVRSTTREWGFAPAAERLKGIGVNAVVEDGVLPQKRADVAGAMIGIADFAWEKSGSTILPGAICEHLTSCGGMMGRNDGQTPLTAFLRHGAAGAAGTVTEPYALQGKFPTPFIHWFYAQGSNLAEAFYQSVSGPYQLLIVGDALCRPWGKQVAIELPKYRPDASQHGKLRLKPKVVGAATIPQLDVWLDGLSVGRFTSGSKAFVLDTRRYADGWHELRLSVAPEHALKATGCTLVPLWLDNQKQARLTASVGPGDVVLGKPLEVTVAMPRATAIELWHLGRVVGQLAAAQGVIAVDTRQLGAGPVTLYPRARLLPGKAGTPMEIRGAPVAVTIVPQ